jgi:hypothetical protein
MEPFLFGIMSFMTFWSSQTAVSEALSPADRYFPTVETPPAELFRDCAGLGDDGCLFRATHSLAAVVPGDCEMDPQVMCSQASYTCGMPVSDVHRTLRTAVIMTIADRRLSLAVDDATPTAILIVARARPLRPSHRIFYRVRVTLFEDAGPTNSRQPQLRTTCNVVIAAHRVTISEEYPSPSRWNVESDETTDVIIAAARSDLRSAGQTAYFRSRGLQRF